MKYFAAIIFVFGIAILIDALHVSKPSQPSTDLLAGDAGWSLRMFVSWLAIVVGLNGFIISLMRELSNRPE